MNERNLLEFVLLKYFSGTENVTRETAGELEKIQANALIDAFAHELAEKIRERGYFPPLDGVEVRINNVIDSLADGIDPEVTNV